MIGIPKELQNPNYRFILVKHNSKKPLENDWTNKGYKYDDQKLLSHLNNGGNYGVLCGQGNLLVIDVDNLGLIPFILEKLGDTLKVRTGSGKLHFYYIIDEDIDNKDLNKNQIHWAEIRYKGRHVVAPESIHPDTGKKYEIENPDEPTHIKKEDIDKLIEDFNNEFDKEYTKFYELLNKDKKLKSLFDDDNEGYPSRSEGDLAFMEKICYYGFTKEQCFEIFDRSKRSKYHEKQGYPQYREDLYEKALVYAQKDREISIEDLDFNELCNIARQCYSAKDSEKIKEGENLIVAYFLYKYNFLALEDSQEIYVYREGIYIPNGETAIAKQTQRILGTLNSIHRTNEIIGHVKRSTYIPRDKFIEPLNLLCLENGIFNIDTMTLEKFSPEHIFLNKLPVEFNPNADCPKTKRFLREVVIPRDEWDNEDYDDSDILTLQEFAGYLLYKNIIFNRAVMLYGEGENGKTTLINLIKEFLGRENVSNVPIQKLEKDKFAVASLLGKLANLHADLPKSALRETSTFKQITGGDTVDAEKKFRDNFSFKPYAKMMYAANTLPVTYDDTKAFWRRWLIFRFGNSFSEDDKNTNKDLLKELSSKEELSGLFNWAIEGLKRLLENKQFTTNKSTTEVREEYIRQSDSVGAFILDLIVEDNSSFEYKKYVYETYSDHCRTNGYEILPENTFHRIFHQKVRVRETHPLDPVTNKQKAAWKGIKILLKKEIEDVEKQKQL